MINGLKSKMKIIDYVENVTNAVRCYIYAYNYQRKLEFTSS